jgi:putative endonuclease
MYFVYILRCGDGSLYTGITTDVARRSLSTTAATAPNIPVPACRWRRSTGSAAGQKRRPPPERAIKALTRAEKLRLIAGEARRNKNSAKAEQTKQHSELGDFIDLKMPMTK